jgi:RNA polymerase sigma-70 factor, ECF subfamily
MDALPAPDLGATLLGLYDEALPAVYGYLRRRVATDSVAQDLTSETFLSAVSSIQSAVTSTVSVGWLIGIARHKLLDHFRRIAREERNLRAVASTLPDHDDPWRVTLRDDLTRATLDQLGGHHRSALTLRHLDGLSVPEVAKILGRTVHATETLLVRARVAFRVSYEIEQQRSLND